MPKKLIVPGIHGSGDGHWQRIWLEENGDAVLVEQEAWHQPDLDLWLSGLEKALTQHPGALIVAHSFGCLVTAGLATRPSRHLVGGALLVAPCDLGRASSIHPDAIAYGPMPMARLGFPSILVASRNDPYLSFDNALSLADHLGSAVVDLGHAGHVNIASGYGRWSHGYRLAERLEHLPARQASPVVSQISRGAAGVFGAAGSG